MSIHSAPTASIPDAAPAHAAPAPKGEILYLSYDGLTDPLGQSQILPYLIGLARRGYRFTVVSTEKPAAYRQRKPLIDGLLAPLDGAIRWHPIFYTKTPPVLSTLHDVWQMRRLAARLHRRRGFAAVHCRSYVTALVGLGLKRRFGLPFIFDMRGFWADERVEGGLWHLANPVFRAVYGFFKKKEKQFLLHADHTVSLTAAARDEIHSWPGFAQVPITVIPCCVDMEAFQTVVPPAPSKGERKAPSFGGDWGRPVTLSYLGSLGTWYLLDAMLLFFKRLQHHRPGSEFLFITPDPPQGVYEAAARLSVPADSLRIERAERRQVPGLLAQSQVSVFFIKPSYSKKASSPTKMGELLAMGLPVVCNAGVGDTDLLMQTHAVGERVHTFTEAEYDRVIGRLDELLALPPDALRQVAAACFALEKGVDLYEEMYGKLPVPHEN